MGEDNDDMYIDVDGDAEGVGELHDNVCAYIHFETGFDSDEATC
jgi:hypothetical protein